MENEIYKLIYDINKQNNIRILGENFVRNNKNKGKIINKNKKYPLSDLIEQKDITNNTLKIKMILSKDCYNKSFMFADCSSLLFIKFYNQIYTKQDILFNYHNDLNVVQDKNKYMFNYEKDDFDNENYHFLQNSWEICGFQNDNINEYSSSNESSLSFNLSKIKKTNNSIIENESLDDDLNSFIFYSRNSSEKYDIYATNLSYMFYGCSSLTTISGLSKLNTNYINDMSHMFEKYSSLKNIIDIFELKISRVIDISFMFADCSSLECLPDISNWNTNYIKI